MIKKRNHKNNNDKVELKARSKKDLSDADCEMLYLGEEEPWSFSWRASQIFQHELYINTLEQFGKKHYHLALDIGCAQGQFTRRLQEVASEIIAVDISKTTIEKAQGKYKHNSNIKFEVGSLPYLKYKDKSFDLVVALEVLYYLKKEEQKRGLEEIKRVMRDDGHLLFSTVIRGKPYFSYDEIKDLISQDFVIEAEQFKYFKLFYMPFEVRIYNIWYYIELFKKIAILHPDELELFFNSKSNSIKKIIAEPVLAFLNKHVGSSTFGLKLLQTCLTILQYPLSKVLRSMTLTRLGVFLTKGIMGRKGATGVIILARKKK